MTRTETTMIYLAVGAGLLLYVSSIFEPSTAAASGPDDDGGDPTPKLRGALKAKARTDPHGTVFGPSMPGAPHPSSKSGKAPPAGAASLYAPSKQSAQRFKADPPSARSARDSKAERDPHGTLLGPTRRKKAKP